MMVWTIPICITAIFLIIKNKKTALRLNVLGCSLIIYEMILAFAGYIDTPTQASLILMQLVIFNLGTD